MSKFDRASVNRYLERPYARILTPDTTGGYFAQILEFPGCFAEGLTPDDAYRNLDAAAASWLEAVITAGQHVPDPTYDTIRDYSGKVALRLPRSVHREAVRFAERENTSLNQFLVSSISAAVGALNMYEAVAKRIDGRLVRMTHLLAKVTTSIAASPTFFPTDRVKITEGGYTTYAQ